MTFLTCEKTLDSRVSLAKRGQAGWCLEGAIGVDKLTPVDLESTDPDQEQGLSTSGGRLLRVAVAAADGAKCERFVPLHFIIRLCIPYLPLPALVYAATRSVLDLCSCWQYSLSATNSVSPVLCSDCLAIVSEFNANSKADDVV